MIDIAKSVMAFVVTVAAAIVFMFTTFETKTESRFVNQSLKEILNSRLNGLEARFDRIETKIDKIIGGKNDGR